MCSPILRFGDLYEKEPVPETTVLKIQPMMHPRAILQRSTKGTGSDGDANLSFQTGKESEPHLLPDARSDSDPAQSVLSREREYEKGDNCLCK